MNAIPVEPEDECKRDPDSVSLWEPKPPSLLSCLPWWEGRSSLLASLGDLVYVCKVEQPQEETQSLWIWTPFWMLGIRELDVAVLH